MFWSYQMAIGGVRDAARYLARVAPADICNTAGATLDGYTRARLAGIVAGHGGERHLPSRRHGRLGHARATTA